MRLYTIDDVKASKSFVICNNRVYDISSMIDEHTGGNDALIKKIGQDVTVDYHFHGRSAQKAWHKLEVGKIKGTDCSIQ